MYMYMCVYIYTHIHIHSIILLLCVCVYIYIYIYIHTHVYTPALLTGGLRRAARTYIIQEEFARLARDEAGSNYLKQT